MSTAIVALIVAAGRGERMRDEGGPKQFRMLEGRSVLSRSLHAFMDHPRITNVQVVIHPDDHGLYASAIGTHARLLQPVNGGATRQASVHAGLEAIAPLQPKTVLIHDAARPFISTATLTRLLDAVEPGTGALPAHRVADTLKRSEDGNTVAGTANREGLWCAQTPQVFNFADILRAHRQAAEDGSTATFTDDAAIAEAAGIAVRLIEAPASNFKITTADDMALAEKLLSSGIPDIRVGNGYDVHRTGPGNAVVLCGIEIPCGFALIGHSDADAGLHALTDALLATVSAGDIGDHFPPSEDRWKGASSDRFLAHAVKLVREAGGAINNLDVTLVCEMPKIGPHRDAMRERIAQICEIDTTRVSVKATTNETIGFIGRGEGIAALASATVSIKKEA